jgi:sarcosine oxidase, subunit gamma
MSDPVSAVRGATFSGAATVREIGPLGMITLRGKNLSGLEKALKAAVGTKVPVQRRIEVSDQNACAWMSPDEYLLILPYDTVAKTMAGLGKALEGQHHLCADVSDARAAFRIEGPHAIEVLRKLVPADLDRLHPGEIRRTRAAQVACALWRDEAGFTLVAFRSVGRYVFDLLANAAQ